MAGLALARPGHPRRPWRAARDLLARRPLVRQVAAFGAIGVLSTLAYVALYAVLRPILDAAPANAFALVVTAVGNTAANRRLTFARSGRDGLVRDQAAGIAALLIALAITTSAVGILGMVAPHAGRAAEVVVLVAANAFATACRFLLLRSWIATAPRRPDRS
jgi:putative flippase GtrA